MGLEFSENEVRFDRSELKVLASDTRVEILKRLKDRNFTVSELSSKLGHSKSTMHEHISKLVEAQLVEKADNYTDKWVYYRLSRRGKELFVDSTKRMVVIISSILLIVGVMQLAVFFSSVPLLAPQDRTFAAPDLEGGRTLGGQELTEQDILEEEATSPEAIAKEHPLERPAAGAQIVSGEGAGGVPAGTGAAAPGGARKPEEIPYYLVGGIGFISAAFILAHYYHSRPNKLFLEKKRKGKRSN